MAISKIIADSITDEAVTSAKIAQGTVVAADVADGTITNAKIDSVANTKITGVITNAQLANTTGSGAVVLTTSPTLVTPALGTPSALVGTNISGTAAGLTAGNVTTNANLTGQVTSVGNAAVLGSFTSAQLATALSDETGSGLAVFGTSPNLITPILGTPTSGNLTNCTGAVVPALSTASGSAPSYSARAWVNFNGTGVVAIRGSGNVSSITDNATGSYTMNFTTSMPDTNYNVVGTSTVEVGVSETIVLANFTPPGTETASATGSFKFAVIRPSVTVAADVNYVYLSVFR